MVKHIETLDDLNAIRDNPTGEFKLVCDIDASETKQWRGGEGFTPIKFFNGKIDGNGYSIKNLHINSTGRKYWGMIGLNNGKIKDLTIKDSSISGNNNVGGFTGSSVTGKLENLTLLNTKILGGDSQYIGGISGMLKYSDVTECKVVESRIKGRKSSSEVGGLAGFKYRGKISECEVIKSKMTSDYCIGGLVGEMIKGDILRSGVQRIEREGNAGYPVGSLVGKRTKKSNNGNPVGSRLMTGKELIEWKQDQEGVKQKILK